MPALITYAVALAFVAAVRALLWMWASCDQAEWQLMLKASGPVCGEFWINRYQAAWSGFVSAGATLAAAAIAWTAVQKQLAHAEETSRYSRWQAANSLVDRMHADRERFDFMLSEVTVPANMLISRSDWSHGAVDAVAGEAASMRPSLNAVDSMPSPWGPEPTRLRRKAMMDARQLAETVLTCFQEMRAQIVAGFDTTNISPANRAILTERTKNAADSSAALRLETFQEMSVLQYLSDKLKRELLSE